MGDHYKKVREKYRKGSKDYWNSMARKYKSSAILIPGDLEIKNQYYNLLHERVMSKVFSGIPKGSKILEIGCGVGRWSIKLAKMGMDVTATDISKEMVKIAKTNAKREKVKIGFQVTGADEINSRKNYYDYALSVTVLQHIIDESKRIRAIENLAKSVKKGGRIILLERVGKEIGEFHVKPFTLKKWKSVFNAYGYELEKRSGVDLSPFITIINKIGAKVRYKGELTDFPGKDSLEDTMSRKALSAYKTSLRIATKLSKPIDYHLADLPWLKSRTAHNILIFKRVKQNLEK